MQCGIICADVGGGVPAGTSIIPGFLYKSNTSADLVFHFSTECTLFNYVKGKSNDNVWTTSKAGVIIWIEVDDNAGFSSPLVVKTSDSAPTGTTAVPNGKVTFCNREVGLRVSESDPFDGEVQVELAIKSMGAHAFNWVLKNPAVILGTNQYYIRVQAAVDLSGVSANSIAGAGFRQRTLIVDSIHLANTESF